VEAETAITDVQATVRRFSLKHRDGGAGHAILLVADTLANREVLRLIRGSLSDLLPLDTRQILAALRRGADPGGSGVVIL